MIAAPTSVQRSGNWWKMIQPDRITRRAASASRSSIQGRAIGMTDLTLEGIFNSSGFHSLPVVDDFFLEQLLRRLALRAIPVEQSRQTVGQ